MKFTATLFSILLIFVASLNLAHAADQIIGSIKNVEGNAFINRNGENIAATKGHKLYQNDTLLTEDDSSMGVILRDDTLISLGANTEIAIKEFRFAPAKQDLSVITRMARGIITYVSGQIAKLSPESARFETPVASIGVRGTKFLVKIDDN